MKSMLIILLLFVTSVSADPPFNYFAARSFVEERTKTDMPDSQRLFVLGPEKFQETYSSNHRPAEREISKPRVVSVHTAKTVQDLWATVGGDHSSEGLHLSVYRSEEPIKPIVTILGNEMELSDFILLPGDVIFIREPKLGFIL